MRIQLRNFKVGDVVFTKHCAHAYQLPAGLPEGVKVKVVHIDVQVYVEYDGRQFSIDRTCVDNGDLCESSPDHWEIHRMPGFKEPLAKWRTAEPPHLQKPKT